jgi:hypothetical protein
VGRDVWDTLSTASFLEYYRMRLERRRSSWITFLFILQTLIVLVLLLADTDSGPVRYGQTDSGGGVGVGAFSCGGQITGVGAVVATFACGSHGRRDRGRGGSFDQCCRV